MSLFKTFCLIATALLPCWLLADCVYEFNAQQAKLTWTAYKLPEKAGVNGTFNTIQLKGPLKGASLSEVLKKTEFSIKPQSVNTKDKVRDMKIARSFFSSMKGANIEGSFKVLNGQNSGELELKLKMNGVQSYVPMSYSVANSDTLKIEGVLNILAFSLGKQLDALNIACRAKHKNGYTWADVKLSVEAPFIKKCK